jgi:hypothetical protein
MRLRTFPLRPAVTAADLRAVPVDGGTFRSFVDASGTMPVSHLLILGHFHCGAVFYDTLVVNDLDLGIVHSAPLTARRGSPSPNGRHRAVNATVSAGCGIQDVPFNNSTTMLMTSIQISALRDGTRRSVPPGAGRALLLALLLVLPLVFTSAAVPGVPVADPAPSDTTGFRMQILRYTYPGIDIRVTYPELAGTSATVKEANRILHEYARQRLEKYRQGAFEGLRLMREIEKNNPSMKRRKRGSHDLYAAETARVWRLGDTLASVLFSAEYFFGGAHPADEEHSIVLDLTGSKVRALDLPDLFRHDCRIDSLLREGYVRSAVAGEQGGEPRFTEEQLRAAATGWNFDAFVPTESGILLLGRPLARYIGLITGVVPYADLASCMASDGPLGQFVPSGSTAPR